MLTAAQLPNPKLPWPIHMDGVALIAEYEQGPRGGVALFAYRCPAGVWTCGWGETDGVGPETRWTKDFADRRFCDSLGERVEAVRKLVTGHTTAHELAAMVSLAYNIGNAGFARSSVLSAHNRGDKAAAARAFALWNKATINGRLTVLNGLVARRAREAALYLTPDEHVAPEPMPQAVAPESSLAKSPIAAGGAVAAVTGVVQAISEPAQAAADQVGIVAQTIQQAKHLAVDVLGIPQGAILPLVLIGAGLVVIWWRHKQRKDGWA